MLQSIRNRASQLFRLQSVKTTVSPTLIQTKSPLFHRHTPWWARWTWGLIACDIFMTGSVIELTYNHWSVLVPDYEGAEKSNGEDAPIPEKYVLRPSWQRIPVCTAHLAFGSGIAAALLITQTRFVRTLAIIPPSASQDRRLFIQCAHNFRKNGILVSLSKSSLRRGRSASEMILKVDGERGHWYIGLDDAKINGHHVPIPLARAGILAAWNGKSVNGFMTSQKSRMEMDKRWKSGPMKRAGGH